MYAPAVKALLSLLAVEHSSLSQKERVRAVGREEGGDDGGSGNQKQLHLGNVRVAMIEALFDGSPLICKWSNRPSEPACLVWDKMQTDSKRLQGMSANGMACFCCALSNTGPLAYCVAVWTQQN